MSNSYHTVEVIEQAAKNNLRGSGEGKRTILKCHKCLLKKYIFIFTLYNKITYLVFRVISSPEELHAKSLISMSNT